jgi:hypothetical protein
MPQISLKSNARELLATIRADEREIKRALMRAVNRTADNFATAGAREVAKVYNVAVRTAREQISTRYGRVDNPTAYVVASGHAIALSEFGARWSRNMAGASFKVKRGGQRQTLAGTFTTGLQSGHKGVFERRGDKRLPIDEKYSIGVPGMFGATQVQDILASVALDRFTVNLQSQLDYLFRRR